MEESSIGREYKDQMTHLANMNESLDEKQDPSILEISNIRGEVERFNRMCQLKDCRDAECLQLRDLKNKIDNYFLGFSCHDPTLHVICKNIHRHSRGCDDVGCKIPFCGYLSLFMGNWLDVLPEIRNEYNHASERNYSKIYFKEGCETIIMDTSVNWPSGLAVDSNRRKNSNDVRFLQIRKSKTKKHPYAEQMESHDDYPPLVDVTGGRFAPRPGLDFVPCSEYILEGRYRCLADSNVVNGPFEIELIQTFFQDRKDYEKKYLESIKRLRNVDHKNISNLLWIIKDNYHRITFSYLHLCCDRELELLCGRLTCGSDLCRLVLGFISGTRYLHERLLYYMNWDVSVLRYDEGTVSGKLYDFQYIFDFSGTDDDFSEDEDLHALTECLNYSNIPKELHSYHVGEYTEVYGLGSIMFHLISGRPLLYEVRHQTKEVKDQAIYSLKSSSDSINEMISSHVKDFGQWQLSFTNVLENLLGDYPTRWSLETLEKHLEVLR